MVADFSKELVEDIARRVYGPKRGVEPQAKAEVRGVLKALAESPVAQQELGLRFGPSAVATQKSEQRQDDLESIRGLIEEEGGFDVSLKVIDRLFQGEDFILEEVGDFTVEDRDTREAVLARFAINLGYGVWPYNSGLAFERAQYDAALAQLKAMHDSLLDLIERGH